jgi:hypothetical protein
MAEQPELDLSAPEPVASRRPRRRPVFAGLTKSQIAAALLLLAAAIWGMWVTRSLVMPREDHIVSARLSAIVGEYVQAQARSTAPPAQVEAEMRAFMASLDKELQRRSAGGQIVLVGEAVLTKNVPDITDKLRQAVYAAGVPHPRQASAEELERLNTQALAAAQPPIAQQAPVIAGSPFDPAAPAAAVPAQAAPQPQTPYAPPAAQVSTFGGGDGSGQ